MTLPAQLPTTALDQGTDLADLGREQLKDFADRVNTVGRASAVADGAANVGYKADATGSASGRDVAARLDEDKTLRDFNATGDGVADDSTPLTNAQAHQELTYAGAGRYKTATYQAHAIFGPGANNFAGVDIPGNTGRDLSHHARASRNALASARNAGTNFAVVIGDSIAAGYNASSYGAQWVSLLRDYMQLIGGASRSMDCITLLNEYGRYDMGVGGSIAFGAGGPVDQAATLQPGAFFSFTGSHNFIGVFYERASGAGSIEIESNGVVVSTISCAGTAASDVWTGFVATGANSAGPHKVRAVGAAVTITGIMRAQSAVQDSTPYFARCARPAWGTMSFTNARIDSALRMADPTGQGRGTVLVALGTNDMINASVQRTPAQFAVELERIFSRIAAVKPRAGVVYIFPARANFTTWPITSGGAAYADYEAAAWEVCYRHGVPMIDIDSLSLLERGWYTDGVHPNDAGHRAIARHLAQQLRLNRPGIPVPAHRRALNLRAEGATQFSFGAGTHMAYANTEGYLWAHDYDAPSASTLNLSHTGGHTHVGTTSARVTMSGGSLIARGNGSFPSAPNAPAGVVLQFNVGQGIGYIYGYDFASSVTRDLRFQHAGGQALFGSSAYVRLVGGTVCAEGNGNPSAGEGLMMQYTAGQGYLHSRNNGTATARPLNINHAGGDVNIGGAGAVVTVGGDTGVRLGLKSATAVSAGAAAGFLDLTVNGVQRKMALLLP